jgi:hypothetical protein
MKGCGGDRGRSGEIGGDRGRSGEIGGGGRWEMRERCEEIRESCEGRCEGAGHLHGNRPSM